MRLGAGKILACFLLLAVTVGCQSNADDQGHKLDGPQLSSMIRDAGPTNTVLQSYTAVLPSSSEYMAVQQDLERVSLEGTAPIRVRVKITQIKFSSYDEDSEGILAIVGEDGRPIAVGRALQHGIVYMDYGSSSSLSGQYSGREYNYEMQAVQPLSNMHRGERVTGRLTFRDGRVLNLSETVVDDINK